MFQRNPAPQESATMLRKVLFGETVYAELLNMTFQIGRERLTASTNIRAVISSVNIIVMRYLVWTFGRESRTGFDGIGTMARTMEFNGFIFAAASEVCI
jgi:hypothetical protein